MPPPLRRDIKGKGKKKNEEIKIPPALIEQFQPQQYQLACDIFKAYDKKNEGLLKVDDIGLMLRLTGGNPTESEVEEWMEASKNEDGKMNLLNWIQVCALELRTRLADTDVIVAFETFDHEDNGRVKAEEIRRHLISKAEAFPENVADQLVSESTTSMDENGNINYRDFIAHMTAVAEKAWRKKQKKLGIAGPETSGKKGKKGKKKK